MTAADILLWVGMGGCGGEEGSGEGGWGEALIEVLNKTGIITSDLGVVTHVTTRNRGGIPIFGGNPHVMTS